MVFLSENDESFFFFIDSESSTPIFINVNNNSLLDGLKYVFIDTLS